MLELKPCPFCGGDAVVETFQTAAEKVPRFRARCAAKCCETSWDYFSEEEIYTMWNRRAEHEHPD